MKGPGLAWAEYQYGQQESPSSLKHRLHQRVLENHHGLLPQGLKSPEPEGWGQRGGGGRTIGGTSKTKFLRCSFSHWICPESCGTLGICDTDRWKETKVGNFRSGQGGDLKIKI